MAGINAALQVNGEPPLVLDRTEAYTAILIDDLISKGTNEPYRMFTSRAEFRLHLRIDNADRRLTPHGRRVGLVKDDHWAMYLAKQERMDALRNFLQTTRVTSEMVDRFATASTCHVERSEAQPSVVEAPLPSPESLRAGIGAPLAQLLKRPEISIDDLLPLLLASDQRLATSDPTELRSVETEIKFAGYLQQQERAIERLKKAEQRQIPDWFDYSGVSGLSREMREKLERVRPGTLAQASRIPGVTPAALSLVNVYIEIQARRLSAEPRQSV
jgi:tRNA uridine 5-carboxymethylaminomethyl modification enzyme